MYNPSVLTVILNYKTPDMTLEAASAARVAMQGILGEIVIVDNASGDDSYKKILNYARVHNWLDDGRVRVIESPKNGGFGAGMNYGMRAELSNGQRPDFYYLLNSDAFPEPNAIRVLRDFMVAHPRSGFAGSYIRGIDYQPHHTAFRFPSIAGEFEGGASTGFISSLLKDAIVAMEIPTHEAQVDWTAGASFMIRRKTLDETGGFDEAFFLYFEETELCYRAARSGWDTYYVPESKVAHVGSVSTGMKNWDRTPKYWLDSRLYYFTKNHGRRYAAAATLARVGGCLINKVRCFVENKPQTEPKCFLRDLLSHMLINLPLFGELDDRKMIFRLVLKEQK